MIIYNITLKQKLRVLPCIVRNRISSEIRNLFMIDVFIHLELKGVYLVVYDATFISAQSRTQGQTALATYPILKQEKSPIKLLNLDDRKGRS